MLHFLVSEDYRQLSDVVRKLLDTDLEITLGGDGDVEEECIEP